MNLSDLIYIKGNDIILIRASSPTEILEARIESYTELKQWMGWSQTYPTLDLVVHELAEAANLRNEQKSYRFNIYKDDMFVGSTGISRIFTNSKGIAVEVGYWIRKSEQQKGIAKEALSLISTYLLQEMQVKTVYAKCDTDNIPSIRTALSAGMTDTGRTQPTKKMDGNPGTYKIMSFTNKDQPTVKFTSIKILADLPKR